MIVPALSTQAAPVAPPPVMASNPAATGTATVVAIREASAHREFAVTRVISPGSSRGVPEALVTPYAFCSSSTPKAAGSRDSESACCTAPAMPQHNRPRANIVPASTYRRPRRARSRNGPTNGASSANGAIVTIRARATRPRAWVTDALKKRVPASATATKPSPALPPADDSMRWARPVRPAPEALASRCIACAVPRPAAAPARAADREADRTDRVARPALCDARRTRAAAPGYRMRPVLGLGAGSPRQEPSGRQARRRAAATGRGDGPVQARAVTPMRKNEGA